MLRINGSQFTDRLALAHFIFSQTESGKASKLDSTNAVHSCVTISHFPAADDPQSRLDRWHFQREPLPAKLLVDAVQDH